MQAYLTYEQFGAVGDGQTNDLPAILRTHTHANRVGLPVRAKAGATYYLDSAAHPAEIRTSVDWTGAKFVIDDRDNARMEPVFTVPPQNPRLPLTIGTLSCGQTALENPYGCELYVRVVNDHHRDYIRKGLNQDDGSSRRDNFILHADGTLSSPVSFDFTEITWQSVRAIEQEPLVLRGGEFTTIANQAESKYNYRARGIAIRRSNVEVDGITHSVTGELDHGAPYAGFITIDDCAYVTVHDCVFTGRKTYWTIGSAGQPVPMGSYDITIGTADTVSLLRCTQTNDILDQTYWGLIGTNGCRNLLLEDCVFSRFDAHTGVHNCTIRRCRLGWQCLNAIGHGLFRLEDTELYGYAVVNLRQDYGCSWRGDMEIRNCVWHPLGPYRSVFGAGNDGTHDFGYDCYLPQQVVIDGLDVVEGDGESDGRPLTIFCDFLGGEDPAAKERPHMMRLPLRVEAANIHTNRPISLCEAPERMPDTAFVVR